MSGNLLSPAESRRYQKQIMLPEIGIEGQNKLRRSAVLVVGAGGLGCPVSIYLAAAGIGRLGIAEYDLVNESNLHRQILYSSGDIGKLKSVIARMRLSEMNPLIDVQAFNLRIERQNAEKTFSAYDVIVDATDNLEARYVISDACVLLNKPMVHGAVYRNEGQVSVFNYDGGPDYRKFNPGNNPSASGDPLPANVGLIGVLPGITGTCMANEVIKIITGSGTILSGKMLMFNILTNSFKIIKI